jgi:hypothetical protein
VASLASAWLESAKQAQRATSTFNTSMMWHPIHLHGHAFQVSNLDGSAAAREGTIKGSVSLNAPTVDLPVGSRKYAHTFADSTRYAPRPAGDADRPCREVRHVVLHEIAHHVGISDERLIELGVVLMLRRILVVADRRLND